MNGHFGIGDFDRTLLVGTADCTEDSRVHAGCWSKWQSASVCFEHIKGFLSIYTVGGDKQCSPDAQLGVLMVVS